MVRKSVNIFIFISLCLCFSCEKNDVMVICSECTAQEPKNIDLNVKLDPGFTNTVLRVYEGNIEDSILIRKTTTNLSETTVSVSVNKLYTLTATYHKGTKSYVAIDSARPGVKYDEQQCDNPCYYVYGKTVNLKIKYFK